MNDRLDETIAYVLDLPVARDRLWAALTSNRALATWLCDSAHVVATIGGPFDLFWKHGATDPERGGSSLGQVLFVDRPRLLTFTSTCQPEAAGGQTRGVGGGETTVTITLYPTLDGVRLELAHGGWSDAPGADDARRWVERRWAEGVERLPNALARWPRDAAGPAVDDPGRRQGT
jgi:uncharacterized protein YndB with AHSA1/START domain